MFLAQLAEGAGVTDVDDAEGFVLTEAQGDLAVRALQVADMQLGGSGCVEQHLQDVAEKRLTAEAALAQVVEGRGEDFSLLHVEQARLAAEEPVEQFDRPALV